MKVRSDIIKLAKNLHTWVGITTGILLFICFFAGGLTMFQHHLSQWATPPQQSLPAIEQSQYQPLLERILEQYPDTQNSVTISFAANEAHNAPIQWQAVDKNEEDDHHIDIAQKIMLASIDKQGELIVQQQNVSKLGWLIEQLHETAGIPGMLGHHTLGVMVMGVAAILYFLALMTGLIVLLPTLVKDYFAVRPGKNKKRFWLDTHNVVGISSLPFHIIISISVIVFAFHDIFYGVLIQTVGKDTPLFERPAIAKIADPVAKIDLNQMVLKVQQAAPDYRLDAIRLNQLSNPERASAFATLYHPDRMMRGDNFEYLSFNPYQQNAYSNATLSINDGIIAAFIRSMFALHFGNYGGEPIRWIYVLFGLGGAYLFYSGNILWIETRLRKQKNPNLPQPKQRKDVQLIANLTIGTCIGCMLAIFGSILIGKWSYVVSPHLSSHNHVFLYSYYIIFILSIIYSFILGAAKALPQFLLTIAIILLAIPLTSLLAYLLSIQGLWYSTGYLIIIDLVAVIFSFIFFVFYRRAKSRAKIAPIGSIWSIQGSVEIKDTKQ